MKYIILTLTFLLTAIFSYAQKLAVESFTHDEMNLEARLDGGRTDLNGKQCALLKVMVRDDIVECKGGNVGDIISKGVVKKIFVSPSARFLEFEFKYNFPLKVAFADYGYTSLSEGSTYTITLVDAYMMSQQSMPQQTQQQTFNSNAQNNIVHQTTSTQTTLSADILPITVNGVTFNMIKVEGGTFTMGATPEMTTPLDNEKPTHQVTLSSYYIGETEVTQGLWKAVMGTTVCDQRDKADTSWPIRGEGDNYPMYYVSWNDCQEFIRKLNDLTGKRFRLPTEAEWEFAARGGNKSHHTQFSGSTNIDEVAWYYNNSDKKTHIVKTKKANELGIYDMSGNVWEWCQDWYGSYSSGVQNNPTGPESGAYRVIRGGSWYMFTSLCHSSNRIDYAPDFRNCLLGLRLVLSWF